MTEDEAIECLAVMMAAWPRMQSMDPDQATFWMRNLEPFDAHDVVPELRWLADHNKHPPAWAELRERLIARKVRSPAPAALEPPGRYPPSSVQRERLARMRQALTTVHRHERHDTGECPTCHRPDRAAEMKAVARWVLDGGPTPKGIR